MNHTTIPAPSRRVYFYLGRFAASRLLQQIARALLWLMAIAVALLVWRAANP